MSIIKIAKEIPEKVLFTLASSSVRLSSTTMGSVLDALWIVWYTVLGIAAVFGTLESVAERVTHGLSAVSLKRWHVPGRQPLKTFSRNTNKYGHLSKPTVSRRCSTNRYKRTEEHSQMSYSSHYTLFLGYLTISSLLVSSSLYCMGSKRKLWYLTLLRRLS